MRARGVVLAPLLPVFLALYSCGHVHRTATETDHMPYGQEYIQTASGRPIGLRARLLLNGSGQPEMSHLLSKDAGGTPIGNPVVPALCQAFPARCPRPE